MSKIYQKVFKDPLYDYINIDNDICDKIIDSQYFQRLKRIEQTSMRCLYPSARHDRFIHSIGVYHLAKIAIDALEKNDVVVVDICDDKSYGLPNSEERKNLRFAFEMAALLHDIGHSPFSHTLEKYFKDRYKKDENGVVKKSGEIIDEFLKEAEILNSENQYEDFNEFRVDCRNIKSAPHEIVSCILIFKQFKSVIDDLANHPERGCKINYLFLARCILGATYSNLSNNNDYKNCIIKLLNSSIDVDKLDYIARDSRLSGFANTLVDTNRLLNSIVIANYKDSNNNTKLCLAFKKTAVGVIQNVVMSRNSLYTWVYSHHKVVYESYLIEKLVKLIADKQEKPNLFISELFSIKSIEENLICDDSIWSLFLNNMDVESMHEIVQRNTQKKALWKSYAEFQAYFNTSAGALSIGDFSIEQMEKFLESKSSEEELAEYVNKFDRGMKFEVIVNKPKLTHIEQNQIVVYINNKLYSFDSIFSDLYKRAEIKPYFYIYCDKETKNLLNDKNRLRKNELIEYIKKYDKFKLQPEIR